MVILSAALIPALLMDAGPRTPTIHLVATILNWAVWLAFLADFGVRLVMSRDRSAFARRAWWEIAIIIVSPPFGVPEGWQSLKVLGALRVVRLMRFARALRAVALLGIGLVASKRVLRHRRFHWVLLVAAGVVVAGALGMFVVERDRNEGITSFGDALWWAATTATTVGYGDIYPRTGEGRLIAVVLMLTGIGVIGIFTATIASAFLTEEKQDVDDLRARLGSMEAKLDRLLADASRQRPDDATRLLPT